jgi:hypothetical protein
LVPAATATDLSTTDRPQMAEGASGGNPATTFHVSPPFRVEKRRLVELSVPAQPIRSEANPRQRKYTFGSCSCSSQVPPPSEVRRIWPLLLTAQPSSAVANQMSSVRELATGALVGRQVSVGVVGSSVSGQPSSIHPSTRAMSGPLTGGSPAGMRLNWLSGGGSGRSAPNGASPFRDSTRFDAAPRPTSSRGRPNTSMATSWSRLSPRQNGPWKAIWASGPPMASSRIRPIRSKRLGEPDIDVIVLAPPLGTGGTLTRVFAEHR